MAKSNALQDPFLNAIRKGQIPVSIFLINGIKLTGTIDAYDQFIIMLNNNDLAQAVYKHAISTVVPDRKVTLNRPVTNE